jgi:hypothetical protein
MKAHFLDFWLEFFEDALEQSVRADRPPADLEQLKVTLAFNYNSNYIHFRN